MDVQLMKTQLKKKRRNFIHASFRSKIGSFFSDRTTERKLKTKIKQKQRYVSRLFQRFPFAVLFQNGNR